MDTSIIMATYKEPKSILQESIESILNQTYQDFECIIILDNPENEEHIAILKHYQAQDKRIRFFVNTVNQGLTYSLNRALQEAKGKYICRMDADDIALPNRILHQRLFLEKNVVDLIGGKMEVIDEKGNRMYTIDKVPSDMRKIKKCIRYNQVIAHPTWFGKREVFQALHGYRNMPLCEDYDFTLRAILSGYTVSNIDEVVLKYRMTASSVSRSNLYEQFLFAKYITQRYQVKSIASVEEAKEFVKRKNTPNAANRYQQANVYFNAALQNLQEKKWISCISSVLKMMFTSLHYIEKVYRLVMVHLYS